MAEEYSVNTRRLKQGSQNVSAQQIKQRHWSSIILEREVRRGVISLKIDDSLVAASGRLQRLRILARAIQRWPHKSPREIADQIGVTPALVTETKTLLRDGALGCEHLDYSLP